MLYVMLSINIPGLVLPADVDYMIY